MLPAARFLGALSGALFMLSSLDPAVYSDELVVAIPVADLEFDPHRATGQAEAQMFTAIYEGLLSYDPKTLDPVPSVAKSWEISEDRRHYTFFLRTEARYDTGDPVLAEDFRASWLRLLSPELGSEYSFLLDSVTGARAFRTGISRDGSTVGIRVRAARILEVELERPDPSFLKILSHYALAPVHPSRREVSAPPFGANPIVIGNGPYRMSRIQTSSDYELTSSGTYWDGESVSIPRIIVRRFLDADSTSLAFNSGELDWAMGEFTMDLLSRVDDIEVNTLFATSYLYFRTEMPPWNDERVRRAMAMLLPLDELRPKNTYLPSTSVLVPQIPGYPRLRGIDSQNRREALRILRDVGFDRGSGLPAIVVRISGNAESTRVATVLEQAWESELGVEVIVDSGVGSGVGSVDPRGRTFTVGLSTWMGDYTDPLTFLSMWRSDSNMNDAGYSDSRYDETLVRAAAFDREERLHTLAEAERLLLDGAVVLPLSHASAVNLIDLEHVDGWYPNVLDIHPFKYLRILPGVPAPGIAMRRDPAEAQSAR